MKIKGPICKDLLESNKKHSNVGFEIVYNKNSDRPFVRICENKGPLYVKSPRKFKKGKTQSTAGFRTRVDCRQQTMRPVPPPTSELLCVVLLNVIYIIK